MFGKKYTYAELTAVHPGEIQAWKDRALRAEAKLKEKVSAEWKKIKVLQYNIKILKGELPGYVFINKKPDYYYSFSGFLIFGKWCKLNGLTERSAELLIIISYVDVFMAEHFKLYSQNHMRTHIGFINVLIKQQYVVKIKVPGKNPGKFRNGWVLTQRGKDMEADYERFYDTQMAAIKKHRLHPFAFDDGNYFIKKKI